MKGCANMESSFGGIMGRILTDGFFRMKKYDVKVSPLMMYMFTVGSLFVLIPSLTLFTAVLSTLDPPCICPFVLGYRYAFPHCIICCFSSFKYHMSFFPSWILSPNFKLLWTQLPQILLILLTSYACSVNISMDEWKRGLAFLLSLSSRLYMNNFI